MTQAVYEKNLLNFWKKMSPSSGFQCLESEDSTFIKGPSKLAWSHYVWGEMSAENIESASTFFKDQPLIWYIDANTKVDPNLYGQIHLSKLGSFPDMVIQLSDWQKAKTSERIKIETVTDLTQLNEWAFVCAESFGANLDLIKDYVAPIFEAAKDNKNDLAFFLGSIDGKPAGVSLHSGGGDQSTILWVGVLESYRKQGLGRAMVEACLEKAKHTGATSSMLNAFAAGKHLYETIGFSVEKDYTVYSNESTPCLQTAP